MVRAGTSWFRCNIVSEMNPSMISAGDVGRFLLAMLLCLHCAHAQLRPVSVIGKPTYLSTTHSSSFLSSYAVDGRLDTIAHNKHGDPHPVLRVDMEEEHCLGRITTTLRDSGCGSEPCFFGTVIRAGLSPDYANNQPCGLPGTVEQSQPGAVSEFLCETPRIARYVTLDIDPSRPGVTDPTLKIAEVEVEEYPLDHCTMTRTPAIDVTHQHFVRLHKEATITNSSPVSIQRFNLLTKCAVSCLKRVGCTAFEYADSLGLGQCRLHNVAVENIQKSPSDTFNIYAAMQ